METHGGRDLKLMICCVKLKVAETIAWEAMSWNYMLVQIFSLHDIHISNHRCEDGKDVNDPEQRISACVCREAVMKYQNKAPFCEPGIVR
jgi:hypothetical protein